jgi:hypothetical protein
MDVHPAVALGSVIAGAALFGPIGALIGIPIAAVALAIVDTFSKRHDLVPELAGLESGDDMDDDEVEGGEGDARHDEPDGGGGPVETRAARRS